MKVFSILHQKFPLHVQEFQFWHQRILSNPTVLNSSASVSNKLATVNIVQLQALYIRFEREQKIWLIGTAWAWMPIEFFSFTECENGMCMQYPVDLLQSLHMSRISTNCLDSCFAISKKLTCLLPLKLLEFGFDIWHPLGWSTLML